ncbi:type I DNA topoisomerase [Mycoplasmopsis verecunda]|uniref:DNA topoisomerase 1 n=1 Tax=Mycoplasmopsis verecunda TaxID=171291 RepID=A0A1T4LB96_9BACT|nr:type I DNA topoisomerase [Mycoplasmopsis verecunda]WPB54801.1 type I DNA topoisomerase [Mycoplasmopsis verecunda]SJZ51767.1 DNA topoisomerase-1 [Mycoplasmopsis verecunda]
MSKKNLIIVESPNKVGTIQKYVGSDYEVIASVGHILKMKTTGQYGFGIDMETWEPEYVADPSKKNVIAQLKTAVKNADKIFIATDPDREGEAIGAHLVYYLKVQDRYSRIKYNEITKEAILKSLTKPQELDFSLIDAQKARRMLDRIIGFRLSKLMRTKLKQAPGTPTAGRVQSIALKLIVDRENEIRAFVPEKYATLGAKLKNNEVLAYYFNDNITGDRKDWILENQLDDFKKYFATAKNELVVSNIKTSERKMQAMQPFKQAVIYRRSPLSSQSTQYVLQKLYEGFGDGGLISYPRTDSTRLSQDFINKAHAYIENKWGKDYVASEIKGFSGDQDAHEAIRPTDVELTPEHAKALYNLSESEYKIYKMIYDNTLQALIKQPVREITAYTYQNGDYTFRNSYSRIKFDGYYVVTGKELEEQNPGYKINEIVPVEEFIFQDHETKPTPRYNDGSLIEALDNIKVGRPSTFASTVKIVKDRNFAVKESGALVPTEFGEILLKNLIKAFPNIINEDYTAKVELELDSIAEDQLSKNEVMQSFWDKFEVEYAQADEKIDTYKFELKEFPEPCPEDGGILVQRYNKKNQPFVACKNFPKCKYTASLPEESSDDVEEELKDVFVPTPEGD